MKKLTVALIALGYVFGCTAKEIRIDKKAYAEKLQGFWLGQSIANWTGLITEMDKIGTPETMPFYTDDDWGKPDQKAFWGEYVPHTSTINFYFEKSGTPWGADDDTDIEYMYLHLHHKYKTAQLTAEQLRQGWLTHTYSETDAPLFKKFADSTPTAENFLWVSNEQARILMAQGMLPPQTSEFQHNQFYNMIDAQLTTEIFGLLAPGKPELALAIAELPIRISANHEAASIARFYIVMHALAAVVDHSLPRSQQVFNLAEQASLVLAQEQFPLKMYQFIKQHYQQNPDKSDWEATRDAVYHRYQLQTNDGYKYEQPFDAGINFAASLISLFYGQGDIVETIRIGTLVGWDSDNPTATWGGLLGFILGAQGVKNAFNQHQLSDTYWIHRTRRNFRDYTPTQAGEDTFSLMAERSIKIINRILEQTAPVQYWLIKSG